ncbi:hypothetical protein INF83_09625 [Enterobacter cloacae complex sp. P3B]|uniref:hypothetical protein n=1 Tax=unclassified Enterobacter cloacae complex TaxID=2757714 RepID=UPI001868244E|nr:MULTISPECIES: hypothetical protein [unclassified Enterobacter cloacae complex]MBE3178204.1 hypothetical protein [Enterobacter cloacae complex sp. P26RS]MBE3434652.1 hypothetical protein [Enterobacter cloacae complex sp. P21RS]MBE3460692.1 hypothetical protein [Enterobacter cloacae complex sp. P21C]MBE3498195.1 hypothetical protein [Enterobacter cloacae complex sp. P2B]MBE3505507.1 hypothetical protein [Enterobacter cloacae complex sp. I11]
MSNIDKQAVQAVADLKAGYTLGHADVAILNELVRIALASLEAEAVCVIDQPNLDYLKSGSDADVWPASRTEMGDVLLYRSAPPAPVSVPECFKRLLHHAYGMTMGHDWNKGTMAGHHRAKLCQAVDECRAAMLQGAEPVTTAYKLPEGWVAVPVELTQDMRAAWDSAPNTDDDDHNMQAAYRAMIEAAPKQEVK